MARSLSSLNRRSVVKHPIMIIYGTKGIGKTTMAAGTYGEAWGSDGDDY